MTTDDAALSHRCLRCGGTSTVDVDEKVGDPPELALTRTVSRPCPTCTSYGPFGLVPAVVAIETALLEAVGPRELELRAKASVGPDALAWLLEDQVIRCPRCDGSGIWTNPCRATDRRPCFSCGGKGVR